MKKSLRKRNGTYYARIQINPNDRETVLSLKTKDKEVAQKKLNEMFQQMEREAEGIAIPTKVRQAAQLPLGKHLEKYLGLMEAQWSSEMYLEISSFRLKKLARECDWKKLAEIDAFSFMEWRSNHQNLSPKTLNDYLSVLHQFMGWMLENGFIETNPIGKVKRMKVRGRVTFQRRALSFDEINQLLSAVEDSPMHRTVYLAAMYTGLRRGELGSLEWGDVVLDKETPYLAVRASTTKNGKNAIIPLHPELLEALKKIRPSDAKLKDLVFDMPSIYTYKEDLKSAGIEYMDERRGKADFHALRKTFGTLMQLSGVNPRTAQELMRHSDIKLTMQTYTDVNLLPTAAAIHSLPSLSNVPRGVPPKLTNQGTSGRSESRREVGVRLQYPLVDESIRDNVTPPVQGREMVAELGFEPRLSESE